MLLLVFAGVYVFPVIDPPPDTMLHAPPEGVPVNNFVWSPVMSAVEVVLFAVIPQTGVTVKVTSSLVATQSPSAAIVYRIVTVVSVLISAGV